MVYSLRDGQTRQRWRQTTRNLSSHDLQTHAGSTLCNPVTLTFDLLTLGSVHADVLPWVYVYQVWCW